MADSTRENMPVIAVDVTRPNRQGISPLRALLLVIAAGVALLAAALAIIYQNAFIDTANPAPVLVESTLGQLSLWMAEQSALENPEAILGQLARNWAASLGQPTFDQTVALNAARMTMVAACGLIAILAVLGTLGLAVRARWTRPALLAALLGLDTLIFFIPWLQGDNTLGFLLAAIFLLLIALFFSPGKVTKFMGFMVVLSALLMSWEVLKSFGAATGYQITLPQTAWTYKTYESLDQTLAAAKAGEIAAAVVDENDVEDNIPPYPEEGADVTTFAQPDLRILAKLNTETKILGLPIRPEFPGRLVLVTRAEDVGKFASIGDALGQPLGAVAGDFADEKLLALPRNLVLIDLKITNDLNMPHLQSIAEALLQPARRQGPVLLVRILSAAALFTWSEAAIGFTSGALLGFLLGALFAHSRLMERGLLPYVVMSQTIPILAIAPVVVLWLGAGPGAVAVISAYLTFFPVTINTLRGLTSPQPTALELMRSYAASKWTVMWKLRFPAALPYIFTALKVSATSSVVGAIIGELPSGIRDGLGGAILNFNQYYTSDPAKLWGAIVIAALVGIAFFVVVSIIERMVLGGKVQGI
jgi:NitT/TauT family transport system permease protein